MDEILAIPQGEICAAVVGRERGEPAVLILMDVGENMPAVRKLIEAAVRQAERDGTSRQTRDL